MKRSLLLLCAVLITVVAAAAQNTAPLRFVQSIDLPNVEGYFDHPAVDIKRQRLIVPGEYQETLEIVDLRAGKVVHSITGLGGHPRKVVYVPQSDQIWVDLGNRLCKAFSGSSFEPVKTVQLNPTSGPDAKREPDNGIYDPATHLFYIGDRADRSKADAKGSIEVVDLNSGNYVGAIEVNDNDPAGLALDDKTPRLFVVLGATSQVAVIDRQKRAVVASWPITGGPLPHALAIDPGHHRLFIGSRVKAGHLYKPGNLVVMDSENGKIVHVLDNEGGADEIEYDAASGRVYFTGTTGAVGVYKQVDADHYELLARVPTSPIAKTSILVPELKRFYVVVPKHIVLTPPVPQDKEASIEDAKIMVFEVLP